MRIRLQFLLFALITGPLSGQNSAIPWTGYAHGAQHTAVSAAAAQSLTRIEWSTPVDLNAPTSGDLYIHYGSPIVTAANTVLIPVKTGVEDGFEVQARSGATGALLYTLPTGYSLPPHDWIPPFGAVLSLSREVYFPPAAGERPPNERRPSIRVQERFYYPGPGGTVYYRDDVDSPTGPNGSAGSTGQIAFYGNALYSANQAAFNSAVQISTPLTSDGAGDIFFGFVVQGSNPANLVGGIARISNDGTGTWAAAASFAGGDSSIIQAALNCAPALSNDESTLYFAVSNGAEFGSGYLVSAVNRTLAPIAHVQLMDPRGGLATVSSDSSASPMVGPDGDVYFGVLENPCCSSHNDRGWMLHFDATLTQTKIPGSFGWDDTASVVSANLVPSYAGSSSYLILTKYNNYTSAHK